MKTANKRKIGTFKLAGKSDADELIDTVSVSKRALKVIKIRELATKQNIDV